ncbi:MAG: holo-ACP synthase [Mycoplasmataceae bacterium]|nr:holo-ACP synthase [Mycoplasmataceae bacterium]
MSLNIKGIGTDISKVNRFSKYDVICRFLTEYELEIYRSYNNEKRMEYAASRWSAKESFVKASGKKSISFKDIEIRNDKQGKPYFVFNKNSEFTNIFLSISHEREYVVTFVILTL